MSTIPSTPIPIPYPSTTDPVSPRPAVSDLHIVKLTDKSSTKIREL